jgi:flagellar assembly protein FliH
MSSSSRAGGADVFAFEPLPPPPPPSEDPEAARAEGYQAGLDAARAELEPALRGLVEALAAAARERTQNADLLEREAVELALLLAEKIVCGAIAVAPERVLDVVQGTLRRVVERERVTVLVNPDDLELVRGAAERLTSALGGIERLEIQGERRVPRGGAVLRTAAGEVDGRIASQLERAREIVEAELGG